MKTLSVAVRVAFLLVCLQPALQAQIPNSGFENWTGDTLTGWWTNNIAPLYATISKSTAARSGAYAVRGEVVLFAPQTIQPIIQSGDDARGFAFSQRPTSVTGYYQFFPATGSGDRFGVNVVLYHGGVDGTPVAVAATADSAGHTAYTQFTATFNYMVNDTPDTCVIQFQVVGPSQQQPSPTAGSYFLLDDISFTGIVGVTNRVVPVPASFVLNQNYPNPFNPTTRISFTVPSEGKATLTVFNLLGQRVAGLFDGAVTTGKYYRLVFNGADLPSGVYFARLDFQPSGPVENRLQQTVKMTLVR